MRSLLWILCAGVSIVLSTTANALITVGALDTPGYAHDVEVVGDLAYVADADAGLVVIDVSDPAAPVELGALDTPGYALDVEVRGERAYVADRYSGLRIIDVSNPALPVELGALDTPGAANGIAVVGDLAYVTVSYSGLHIVDVSNPALPVELGVLDTPGSASDVQVVGALAYFVGGGLPTGGWLRVIDVSNPAVPLELGALVELGAPPDRLDVPFDVEVVGNIAYVGGETLDSQTRSIGGWLRAIDVSNPTSPVVLAPLDLPMPVYGIRVVGDLAYVADGAAGLRAFDVSNPTSPVERGSLQAGTASGLAVVGNVAYVSAAYYGLRVIDVSEPRFPAELSALDTPDAAWDLSVVGGLAYVVGAVYDPPLSWKDGWLRVIDVSNPTLPVELAVFETPGRPYDVKVAGGLAYVAESSGLLVIDVSDPAQPVQIGAFDTPSLARDLDVVGDLACVVGGNWLTGPWLRVIDVSNPTFPVELGVLEMPPYTPSDLKVAGGLAYVADTSGLRVIDISDPTVPVEIGALKGVRDAHAVDVEGDFAYLGEGSWLFRLIDVSDPTSPVTLSSHDFPGAGTEDIEVVGDSVYVKDYWYGLRFIDASNPLALVEVGGVYTSPGAGDIEVVDGLIYVADEWNGLRIFDFGPEYAQAITVDIDIKPGSDPNSINPDDGGVVPVALLGSDTFDVSEVDAATLKFGPDDATPHHTHGPHVEDVNADGLPDLLVHFDTGESGIVFGTLAACVEGAVLNGKPFNGCDAVRTVPDMDGDKLLDVEEAAIGTDALNRDTDGDGYDDGHEVIVMGTDPLNAKDPKPVRERRGGRKRSR